jgi:hypothetical protein
MIVPRTEVFGLAAILAAALINVPSARAQDVVITAQKEVPPAQARHFVRSIASTGVDGQLARFAEPVCPLVMGLPDKYNLDVAQRIRAVATAAGVEVPKDLKCVPNIVVIVAQNGDAFVKELRKKIPTIFVGVSSTQMKRALRDGPVHVWNTVETRNEDGQGMSAELVDIGNTQARVLNVKTASMINLSSQQAVVRSVIILEDDALINKTLTQIADYIAMRTLAGARPPREGGDTATILSLFDAGAVPPPELTSLDRSFLEGVYKMRPTGRGQSQKLTISQEITRDSRARSGAKN